MEHYGFRESLFEPVYVPLDPGDCMCSTMEEAADNIHNLTSFSCSVTDEECTSIRCNVSISPVQSFGMTVSPCDDPPSLQFAMTANDATQSVSVNHNTTIPLNTIPAGLRISIWHFDYSIDVEVSTHSLYTD